VTRDLAFAGCDQECTCSAPIAGPTDIDPPEMKTDPWCPTHGWRDADRERDARVDRELTDGRDWL